MRGLILSGAVVCAYRHAGVDRYAVDRADPVSRPGVWCLRAVLVSGPPDVGLRGVLVGRLESPVLFLKYACSLCSSVSWGTREAAMLMVNL